MRDLPALLRLGGWRLLAIAIIYRTLFPILFILTLPSWLTRMIRRGGWRPKFNERFGFYSTPPFSSPRPFIHAVSVGEMFLGLRVASSYADLSQEKPLTLSCTTTTGMAQAQAAVKHNVTLTYHSVDFVGASQRMLRQFKPSIIAYVEAAPWPNVLFAAVTSKIPVAVINARVSPRSQIGYRRFAPLLRPLFSLLDAVAITDPVDYDFWCSMGLRPERVHLTGNIKFDVTPPPIDLVDRLRSVLTSNFPNRHPILLGGSTFPGEERLLLEAHIALRERHPNLLTILVPRPVERRDEIAREIESLGLTHQLRSAPSATPADVLLVDTTGELRGWYALADAVFIGKSLTASGGQNPVEPVVAGRTPIFGPNMANFKAIARSLCDLGLATQIEGPEHLLGAIESVLAAPPTEAQNDRINALLAPHRGAATRIASLLKGIEQHA